MRVRHVIYATALCAVISASTVTVCAQQDVIDSLVLDYPHAINDSHRVRILGDLAFYYYAVNSDTSYYYAKRTFDLARSFDYVRGMLNGKYKMALARMGQGSYDEAELLTRDALDYAYEMRDTFRITAVLNLLGVVQSQSGNSVAAVESLFESARLGEITGDSINAAYAYNNIGDIYKKGTDSENAYKYFSKALHIWKNNPDTFELVTAYNNVGGESKDSLEKLQCLTKAVTLGETIQYDYGLAYAYKSLGAFQRTHQKDTATALSNYAKALLFSRQAGDQYTLAVNLIDLAGFEIEVGNLEEARTHILESIPICRDAGLQNELQLANDYLSRIQYRSGNHESAYDNLRSAFKIRDSIYSNNLAEKITEANARYELGHKEAEIARQELEINRQRSGRTRTIFGGILALLAATGIYQWYFYRQRKKRTDLIINFNKKLADAETQALRSQMNPHFIFNALNSIKLFVLNKDPLQGSGYLDAFARLVRSVLENSKEQLISLEKELESLELYISLEKLRFDKAFEHQIQIAENIDPDFYQVPPLILQPFVENAIWHGLMHLKKRGKLNVSAELIDESLVITIKDTGIGRKRSAEINANRGVHKTSMGIEITQGRMALQKELTGLDISADITDLTNTNGQAAGTQVIIRINYG